MLLANAPCPPIIAPMNFLHPWVLALILPAWLALLAAALRPGARRSGEWLRTGLSALAAGLLVAALAMSALGMALSLMTNLPNPPSVAG